MKEIKKNVMVMGVSSNKWSWFTGLAKQEGKLVGDTLNEVITRMQEEK